MVWSVAAPQWMCAANSAAVQSMSDKSKSAAKHSSSTFNVPLNNLTKNGLDGCHVYKVKTLPGSREYASEFLETMAIDPRARSSNEVWGLTADMDSHVPAKEREIYLSQSTNGGVTWTPIARLSGKYFNAKIGEGLRNGLAVAPGGRDFCGDDAAGSIPGDFARDDGERGGETDRGTHGPGYAAEGANSEAGGAAGAGWGGAD